MKEQKAELDTKTHRIVGPICEDLEENIRLFEGFFTNCDDVVKKKFQIGEDNPTWGYISYIDVMIDRKVVELSVLEKIIEHVRLVPKFVDDEKNVFEYIKNYAVSTADIKEVTSFDEICKAVVSGDTILLVDGFEKGMVIATRGWPNRGVQEPDTEVMVKGPKDGFSESLRFNTVLIRRRIRDTRLKIKQHEVGTRSRTDIAVVYMEDIVRKSVLRELQTRLREFSVDAIFETGMLEEFLEPSWRSPFPKVQATQRPDKVASALLEGRIAVVVDNTPYVLLYPTSVNNFFQSPEDYYDNWMLASLIRCIRYLSAFLAVSVPSLYIALTLYHPAMIPIGLVYSISASRLGVPFPGVIELLILELAFELLREAGIRLPGAMGNTIGIVGGLIIGQSAVEANLISPIVVVVVALTAIASYAIPSYTMTGAYRIIKYWAIFMSAILGIYGFLIATIIIIVHLVSLKSLGFPYLMPFVSDEVNKYEDVKDTLFRLPLHYYKKRPIYATKRERVRIKFRK